MHSLFTWQIQGNLQSSIKIIASQEFERYLFKNWFTVCYVQSSTHDRRSQAVTMWEEMIPQKPSPWHLPVCRSLQQVCIWIEVLSGKSFLLGRRVHTLHSRAQRDTCIHKRHNATPNSCKPLWQSRKGKFQHQGVLCKNADWGFLAAEKTDKVQKTLRWDSPWLSSWYYQGGLQRTKTSTFPLVFVCRTAQVWRKTQEDPRFAFRL